MNTAAPFIDTTPQPGTEETLHILMCPFAGPSRDQRIRNTAPIAARPLPQRLHPRR